MIAGSVFAVNVAANDSDSNEYNESAYETWESNIEENTSSTYLEGDTETMMDHVEEEEIEGNALKNNDSVQENTSTSYVPND